jgi:hypothetical protein
MESVRLGMKKSDVLTGLARDYKVTEVEGLDLFVVQEKSGGNQNPVFAIWFSSGKVTAISTQLGTDLFGDGVTLARKLFSQLSVSGEPPPRPDAYEAAINLKRLSVPVTLQEIPVTGMTIQKIILGLSDRSVVVEITTPDSGQPYVKVESVVSSTTKQP